MKNVVLLTIDTLRQDVLGCYGSSAGLTPFIDSLQDKCVRFSRAQSCGPYTQASFPEILTSSYYHDFQKSKNLSAKRVLISEVLQPHGIDTTAFHSNAYLCAFFGWNRGWNTFYDSMEEEVDDKAPYIKAGVLNTRVDRWLESRSLRGKKDPFFLWLHYMDVHEPYVPERRFVKQVDPAIDLDDEGMFSLFTEILLKRDVSDPEKIDLLKKLYLAHVREVDEAVEELFSILGKREALSDTIVLIASDHGDEFGEHSGLSHDGKMYRELIDIPLLIYDPDRAGGLVCPQLVSTLDVSPTIVQLFGLDPVPKFQGASLVPTDSLESRIVFGEAYHKVGRHEPKDNLEEVHYCREEDVKIIYSEHGDAWQLYDLGVDPEEKNNVIDSHQGAAELKARLQPRLGRIKDN